MSDHVEQDYDFKAIYRNQGNMKGLLPGATGAHVPRQMEIAPIELKGHVA
jgi:hypothetical protein